MCGILKGISNTLFGLAKISHHRPQKVPSMKCIACGSKLSKAQSPFDAFLHCTTCGIYFLSNPPREKTANLNYEKFYDKEESARFNFVLEFLTKFNRSFRVRDVTRFCGKPGRLLDIGFSRPSDLLSFKDVGWEPEGTQIVQHVVQIARRQNLKSHLGELTRLHLPAKRFDVVTLWHVLEHIKKPQNDLAEISRILKPNGALIIEVPNIEGIVARFFKTDWFHLDPPNHLWQFTPMSLELLLEQNHFMIKKRRFFSAEQSIFSIIQSSLNRWTGKRNVLFEALKKNTKKPPLREFIFHLFLATLLLPFAIGLSLLFAVMGRGDVLRLYCVKKNK
jgi:SAM-dependent methyltransferase